MEEVQLQRVSFAADAWALGIAVLVFKSFPHQTDRAGRLIGTGVGFHAASDEVIPPRRSKRRHSALFSRQPAWVSHPIFGRLPQ